MSMQRSLPATLLIAVACLIGLSITLSILGGVIAGILGIPPDAGVETSSELFGIGVIVAWIGAFKLLAFNPRPRPWKKLAWWTFVAFAVPFAVRVLGALTGSAKTPGP
jgi:hypothetical protein